MKKQISSKKMCFTVKNGLLLAVACIFSPFALSEVTLDGSMGTTGSLVGPDYQITEDLGQRSGGNLFHSFGQFNINSAESATFSGSAGINNVISRVTGGQASTIDGAFRSTIPGANVYFLNPSGVIFGENATLDVQGSFHASTADYLKFKDGVTFETGLANTNPILTTASPEAFGFLNDAPASISISGDNNKVLKVPENETLSLIGGDISIEDRSLYAPSGQVILASAGSTGEVVMNESGIGTSSFTKGGNIHISHAADNPITIIDNDMRIADIDVSANSAGKVVIRGGQMVMDNANIWANTINEDGGGINIRLADDLTINGVPETSIDSSLVTITSGAGHAGNIAITADKLELKDTAIIGSQTSGKGNGGNLTITTNTLTVHDQAIIINLVSETGEGHSGDLMIRANTIKSEGIISNISSGKGHSGDLKINSTSLKVNEDGIIGNFANGTGDSGNLSINTGSLEVLGGLIGTIPDKNNNIKNGNIKIEANSILLVGDKDNPSQITATITGDSDAGNLTITSDKLEIKDWAVIRMRKAGSGTSGNMQINSKEIVISNNAGATVLFNGIDTTHTGSKTAGDVTIKSENLLLKNGANINTLNSGSGDGGKLTIKATESIVVDGSSLISNITSSEGKGGNTIITTKNLQVLNNAQINTSTLDSAHAGNLTINADSLEVQNDSEIGSIALGKGNAGNIEINANKIILSNSAIATLTNVLAEGNAGDITIKSRKIKMSENSNIATATLGAGKGGDMVILVDELFLNHSGLISNSFFQGLKNSSNPDIGKSGNIKIISSGSTLLENNSLISVGTKQANAGEIEIKGEGNLQLTGNSSITTSVANGEGNGGNITVNSPIVSLDSSQIRAQAKRGLGGNISISGFLFQSPKSIISASSEISKDGELNLNPDTNISGSIAILPESLLNVSEQLNDRCNNRTGKNTNSFVVKGKGGIPLSPDKPVSSDFMDFLPTTNSPHNFLKNQNRHHLDNNYRLSSLSIDCILFSSSGK